MRDLVAENRRRTKLDPEYELLDTGAFDDDRYWWIEAEFAKATPDDVYVKVTVGNAGPEPATIDVLPTLWFRNTWAWGIDPRKPTLSTQAGFVFAEHHELGRVRARAGRRSRAPVLRQRDQHAHGSGVCRVPRIRRTASTITCVHGAATINPDRVGTKMAARYRLTVAPGETAEVRFTLGPGTSREEETADEILDERRAEADSFYERLTPDAATEDEARVLRQAFAGMLWSKQFFHFDVDRWLVGDPLDAGAAARAAQRPQQGLAASRQPRCALDARHLGVPVVRLMGPRIPLRRRSRRSTVTSRSDSSCCCSASGTSTRTASCPPTSGPSAMPTLRCTRGPRSRSSASMASTDYEFLNRVLHKLLINFTWWVNRKDEADNNVFEGGFLGLDNIGPIDRGAPMPPGQYLEQSDGTAWMARYCLDLLEIAVTLAMHDRAYEDVATKFFEHFSYIATAMNDQGLWHERDGFYFDVIRDADGSSLPLACRSMVGLIPMTAATVLEDEVRLLLPDFAFRMTWFERNKPEFAEVVAHTHVSGAAGRRLMSIVGPDRLRRVLAAMLDEAEFLSPHGVRSLSRYHLEHPLEMMIGGVVARVDYEPAESMSGSFGGNSNWRGPIWFPVNYVLIDSLRRYSPLPRRRLHRRAPDRLGQHHVARRGRRRAE